jgi:hypothetical protein
MLHDTKKANDLLNGRVNRMFSSRERTTTPADTLTLLAATRIMHAIFEKHSRLGQDILIHYHVRRSHLMRTHAPKRYGMLLFRGLRIFNCPMVVVGCPCNTKAADTSSCEVVRQ